MSIDARDGREMKLIVMIINCQSMACHCMSAAAANRGCPPTYRKISIGRETGSTERCGRAMLAAD